MLITKISLFLKRNISINWLWTVLFLFGLIGTSVALGNDIAVGGNDLRAPHEEYDFIIFPFYFTIWSNVLTSVIGLWGLFRSEKSNRFRFWIVLSSVNMFLTFVIFWSVLFPIQQPKTAGGWISNILVHGISPILMVVAGFLYLFKNKLNVNIWKESLKSMAFIIIWFIIALIIYFSLGGDSSSAIYGFLDFNSKPVTGVIYIIIIAPAYYFLNVLMYKFGKP